MIRPCLAFKFYCIYKWITGLTIYSTESIQSVASANHTFIYDSNILLCFDYTFAVYLNRYS